MASLTICHCWSPDEMLTYGFDPKDKNKQCATKVNDRLAQGALT